MEKDEEITSALNLLKRLPPQKNSEILAGLVQLSGDIKEEILRRSFLPFQILYDEKELKYYIGCEYNQEKSSFRSPWSNSYDPPVKHGYVPSDVLRELEIHCNALFNDYRSMYYDGGISCVYLWDLPSRNGFAGAFCIHKDFALNDTKKMGVWSSMHTVKVTRDSANVNYRLHSDISVDFNHESGNVGKLSFGTRNTQLSEQRKSSLKVDYSDMKTHITVIGSMIEEAESLLHKSVERILIPRIREIARGMKPYNDLKAQNPE